MFLCSLEKKAMSGPTECLHSYSFSAVVKGWAEFIYISQI